MSRRDLSEGLNRTGGVRLHGDEVRAQPADRFEAPAAAIAEHLGVDPPGQPGRVHPLRHLRGDDGVRLQHTFHRCPLGVAE